ncbi:DUF2726 domain-containing protein [Dickeya fangzhongdai]|uniref:DUF2726 domain-containing protein n=1 Tax=Dickeya fangzhongdai TaxID=1778540 RepID=UPI001EFBEF06|nr:DUF2726 domain-containing protein [Dickeya fangzhongdai]ULR31699.1 DUF2726 domain-containing protein [Dickeya fangzhongdai]
MDFIFVVIVVLILIYWLKSPKSTNSKKGNVEKTYSAPKGSQYEYRDMFIPKRIGRDDLFWGMVNDGVEIKRKGYFLTRSESAFYHNLNKWFGEYCYIHCQVSLGQLIFVPNKSYDDESYRRFSAIVNNMALDYVLVSKKTNKVVCVIELDDETHQRPGRIERDNKLNKILALSKIGFLRVPVDDIDIKPDIWRERDLANSYTE